MGISLALQVFGHNPKHWIIRHFDLMARLKVRRSIFFKNHPLETMNVANFTAVHPAVVQDILIKKQKCQPHAKGKVNGSPESVE